MSLYVPMPLITFILGWFAGAGTIFALGVYLYRRSKAKVTDAQHLMESIGRQIGQE